MAGALAHGSGTARNIVSVVVLCAIGALVLAFLFAMNPRMVEAHAKAQAQLTEEIARENTGFCERRGFPAGIREHDACTQDLNEIRARHDKRAYESVSGLL